MARQLLNKYKTGIILFIISSLIGLYLVSIYSYLLFHSLAELFSIFVAFGIFTIAWNSRHILDNPYFLIIGNAYLFIGGLDLLHTLAFKGMGVFPDFGANLPTQLWIAARYMESLSFVIAPFFIRRIVKANHIFCGYLLVFLIILGLIFYWDVFPVCYVEGAGLTSFKKVSEYLICLLFISSIVILYRRRPEFDEGIFRLLISSIILSIFSEVAFTFYVHVYGLPNLIGHYLKVASFFLMYKAIIVTGLTNPHEMLFRNLRQSEDALRSLSDELEVRIEKRTAELLDSNVLLNKEIDEHKLSKEQLRQSREMLNEVFDGILDPLIVLDANMQTKLLNNAALEYYGLTSKQEAIGKPCYRVFKQLPKPCDGCDIPLAISSAKNISFERKAPLDPSRRENVVIYIIKGINDAPKEFILRIHDITERKMLEKQIIQSEKLASLGVLVSSVAHEINNPNSFVSFNIPILRDYIDNLIPIIDAYAASHPEFELCNLTYPEFRQDIFKLLGNIENGSSRISAFVANLQDYSQDKGKKTSMRVELKDVIERVLTICHSKIKKSAKSFVKNVPEEIPPIYTEPFILEQILINFMINACQAQDKEDSWIKINVAVNHGGQEHIGIEVSDNGCGIDERTQLKIFDPFFTTKSPKEGTGLGLYVSHTLANRLKGHIEIESEPGMGSTFRLILPLKRPD